MVENRAFENRINTLMRFSTRMVHDVVMQQARLLVHNPAGAAKGYHGLIALTPPFAGDLKQIDSLGAQKKVGDTSLHYDILRAFPLLTIDDLSIFRVAPKNQRYIERLKHYVQKKDLEAVRAMLNARGKFQGDYITAPTQTLHRAHRDETTGRTKRTPYQIVTGGAAIRNTYEKRARLAIGRAKAGWLPAARALGVRGLPGWIAGQRGEGSLTIVESTPATLRLRITNNVPYIGELEHRANILAKARANRSLAIKMQLRKYVRDHLPR
jgi:hypothetical protein